MLEDMINFNLVSENDRWRVVSQYGDSGAIARLGIRSKALPHFLFVSDWHHQADDCIEELGEMIQEGFGGDLAYEGTGFINENRDVIGRQRQIAAGQMSLFGEV